MPLQPLLDHRAVVVTRPVHVHDEALGLWVRREKQPQEVDELHAVDVVTSKPVVDVLVVVWAIRPEDVQPLASRAHAHQETLAQQQPAGVDQVQAPNGMAGIGVVAACPWGVWAFRLALVPLHPLDKGTLLIGVCLPQEAAHLVVADADAFEQVLDAAGRVADLESVIEPLTDLIGAAERAGADFAFELSNLVGGKFARVTLVVQDTEGVEPLVAKDTKPFTQLAQTDAQQLSNLVPGLPRSNSQDGGEPLVDPPVSRSFAPTFYFPSLLRRQHYRLHVWLFCLFHGSFRSPFPGDVPFVHVGSPSARV